MKALPIRRAQFKTADFAAWLASEGAEIGTPTNPYEVIRYRAYADGSGKAATHIVYAKETGLLTFTGSSQAHYTQFMLGGQMYPAAKTAAPSNPFVVPKAQRERAKAVADGCIGEDGLTKGDRRRQKLRARDGDDCWFCGRVMGDDCTIEHLIPRSKRGADALDNFVLAHAVCNRRAADLPLVSKIALRAQLRAASVDRSGEAGETAKTGSTEGESAVPAQQADAQTQHPE